jgi:hypothetical protein
LPEFIDGRQSHVIKHAYNLGDNEVNSRPRAESDFGMTYAIKFPHEFFLSCYITGGSILDEGLENVFANERSE